MTTPDDADARVGVRISAIGEPTGTTVPGVIVGVYAAVGAVEGNGVNVGEGVAATGGGNDGKVNVARGPSTALRPRTELAEVTGVLNKDEEVGVRTTVGVE
ncbi:MAG: hypothetical protein B6243_08400 [Anaerolineaceae bacterium 4572_5.2]|nr:MAG: hypothetical protein B6243_08400 [Anaerolineaceae bacterium 4572_5.2]